MNGISSKLVLLGTVCLISACGVTEQASKVQDVAQNIGGAQELLGMTKGVSQTLSAVKSGDFSKAQQEFSSVQQGWTDVQGKLKASPDTLNNIKSNVENIATDLKASPPDKDKLLGNLQTLSGSLGTLAKGEEATPPTASSEGDNTETSNGGAELSEEDKAKAFANNLVAMKDSVAKASTAVESSDFSAAKASFGEARQTWFSFGGSIKEKSNETYEVLDQGVKTVNTALSQTDPAKDVLLSELKTMKTQLDTVTTE